MKLPITEVGKSKRSQDNKVVVIPFHFDFLSYLFIIFTLPSTMGANSVCNRWVTYTSSFSFLYSCARSLTPFIHFAFMKTTCNRSQHLSVYSPTEV